MNGGNALVEPPNRTRVEYIRRIQKALDFIEAHLDQTIRLEEVARASHFSPYHFHRIFHAIVDETVNDYITRKRMERAIRQLISQPETSITEVAVAGGFSSSANFAKAFKSYFGVSPSEIRKPGSVQNSKTGKLYRKYGKAFHPLQLYSQFVTQSGVFAPDKLKEMMMQVKVEAVPEKQLAYLSSPRGYVLDSVYDTWDKMTQWADARGIGEAAQVKLAICHDNPVITPEDRCRYDAAIVVDESVEITPPVNRTVLPAGQYAIAYYRDTADKISAFMTEFCGQWFCQSGYEPDDHPPVFHYLNDSREEGVVEMNVYIKLKPLGMEQ